MSSDTPRTDAALEDFTLDKISADFARQLERELNKSKDYIKSVELQNDLLCAEKTKLYDKIEDLETQLVTINKFEWCDECGAPLCQCGPQGTDGIPTKDCMVCQLRAQLKEWEADRITGQKAIDERNALSAEVERVNHKAGEFRREWIKAEQERDQWREMARRLATAPRGREHYGNGAKCGCDFCKVLAAYERLAKGETK